jgi:hypothetical protein
VRPYSIDEYWERYKAELEYRGQRVPGLMNTLYRAVVAALGWLTKRAGRRRA